MKILIVEDDPSTRSSMKETLKAAGHHVTTAASGMEGILHVEILQYDLVLVDLKVRGIDSFQFAEFMSCHWNTFDTPVLIVSVLKDRESKSLARLFNCAGYLEKPLSPAELFDAVLHIHRRVRSYLRPCRSIHVAQDMRRTIQSWVH